MMNEYENHADGEWSIERRCERFMGEGKGPYNIRGMKFYKFILLGFE